MTTPTATTPLTIVTVNGSPTSPSRTAVLLEALAVEVASLTPSTIHRVEVSALTGLPLAATRDALPARTQDDLQRIETADLIIAGSPVYKGSYTGIFKYLFDFVDQYALVDVPAILVATGGSERHTLVIEHQLRPLFSFFQAATSALGVYAHTSEFDKYEITNPALRARVSRAADRAVASIVPNTTLRELNPAAL